MMEIKCIFWSVNVSMVMICSIRYGSIGDPYTSLTVIYSCDRQPCAIWPTHIGKSTENPGLVFSGFSARFFHFFAAVFRLVFAMFLLFFPFSCFFCLDSKDVRILKMFRLFKTFRLWKCFKLWKLFKYENRSNLKMVQI